MSEQTKPALSAEEWAERMAFDAGSETVALRSDTRPFGRIDLVITGATVDSPSRREIDALRPSASYTRTHALAALALHGQPFGFTREDVRLLRVAAEAYDEDPFYFRSLEPVEVPDESPVPGMYRELAERIESLLPPETS